VTVELLRLLQDHLPVSLEPVDLHAVRCGLVIIDAVNGFATVGAGPLAPMAPDPQITGMIEATDRLARRFVGSARPVLAFLDTHEPGVPEPPYPPHCEAGSGQEELVPQLRWLEGSPGVTLIRKDCINGFVGADDGAGGNRIVDWVRQHRLQAVLAAGLCTDICVMDFVLTLLSARNHRLMPGLTDIVVYEPGCATYDLPRRRAESLGLPPGAAHPQAAAHHLGLYFMASRGARLAEQVILDGS
jgi:nicotinamidase-related amidase